MAHRQMHRGLAPQDARLFAPSRLPTLRAAAVDLDWLLDRGYAQRSALELVGNRYSLTRRQRLALARYACPRQDAQQRQLRRVEPSRLAGQELWLDGYNVLTILESALAGGIVLLGRDGCCRDIAGLHRRHRQVLETLPALELIGQTAAAWKVVVCRWWLDQPVSNSGRLQALILRTAAGRGWPMRVDLRFNPDHVLSHTDHIIATSDGVVLDRCQHWVNLTRIIVAERIGQARLVDLTGNESQATG